MVSVNLPQAKSRARAGWRGQDVLVPGFVQTVTAP